MKNNVLSIEETKDRMDKSYDHVLLFVCLSKSNLPPPHYAGFDVSENEFKELYLNDNIINDAKNVVLERFEINYSRYWCLFHSINKAGGINKYGWFAY